MSESITVNKLLLRSFQVLENLAPEGQVLVATWVPNDDFCRVRWASDGMATLVGEQLSLFHPILSHVLEENDRVVEFSKAEIKSLHPRFENVLNSLKNPSRMDSPPFGLLAIRIDLAGEGIAFFLYSEPLEPSQSDANKTELCFSKEKISTLKNFASLVELAASATDLSRDIRTHQLHLDNLREELHEVQQFYHLYSQAIGQCFWVIDLALNGPLIISENFEKVFGVSREILNNDLSGFIKCVAPEDRDLVSSSYFTQFDKEFDIEFRVVDGNGEIRWIWLRSIPLPDQFSTGSNVHSLHEQPVIQIVLIADDVTSRKQKEESLRSKELQLASNSKSIAVGNLASGVAHEINNPLTVIVGKSNELMRISDECGSQKDRVMAIANKIQSTSIRISEIVSSLKSLSQQKSDVGMVPVPFKKIFNDLKDLCSEKYKTNGVQLELPENVANLSAEMNSTMVTQAILNLINNAFDAVVKTDDPWVKVEISDDVDSIYIAVTDSGPGIPIKIRSQLFDPFFTTKAPGKGTGLGLSLASGVAIHHQGSLRLDNLNVHTRFVLQIPKKQNYAKAA